MKFEKFVSDMMRMNTLGRLWHWGTDIAQHHVTFEQFLTQNEQFTDSFVESVLGNDQKFSVSEVNVVSNLEGAYSLETARKEIVAYRKSVSDIQGVLESEGIQGAAELTAILDDAVELCSKTLYLLKLK